MQDELVKLSCEKKLDDIILEAYALDKAELSKLNETVGVPAIDITGTSIANKLDKVMAQALDANCQIVRTRVNKHPWVVMACWSLSHVRNRLVQN